MRSLYLLFVLVVISALLVSTRGFHVNGYNRVSTLSASPFVSESFVGSASSALGSASSALGSASSALKKEDLLMEYPPGKPAPVDLYRNDPYHLLSDVLGRPRDQEALSCVNSRSCYAVDAEPYLSKVGNYRQLTNNYKREYPDDCSSLRQELVLNFYKAEPVLVGRS